MAERRMFAKAIIGSARFLRMPATSRLLYYDLGMDADDDGCVEAFAVLRKTGANDDDLRVLVSKGFVRILNEDLVSLILDWKTNNYIQKDRYHPSIYAKLIDQSPADTECIHDVSELDTQVRLGKSKVSIGENSLGKSGAGKPPVVAESFEKFWSAYPKKVGKQAAKKAFNRVNVPVETLLTAIERQKCSAQWSKDNGQYIPNPATWLNQGRWEDELNMVPGDVSSDPVFICDGKGGGSWILPKEEMF